MKLSIHAIFILCLCVGACKPKTGNAIPPEVVYKEDTVVEKVVVNITDTLFPQTYLICRRDTANSVQAINDKLNASFKKLLPALADSLNAGINGPRYAWYKNESLPLIFETGFPVDMLPGHVPKPYFVRTVKQDSAFVAHFFGPYSGISVAHEALQSRLKSAKKKLRTAPFEIYVDDVYDENGKLKNPYRVRTDIIYLY